MFAPTNSNVLRLNTSGYNLTRGVPKAKARVGGGGHKVHYVRCRETHPVQYDYCSSKGKTWSVGISSNASHGYRTGVRWGASPEPYPLPGCVPSSPLCMCSAGGTCSRITPPHSRVCTHTAPILVCFFVFPHHTDVFKTTTSTKWFPACCAQGFFSRYSAAASYKGAPKN